MSDLITDIVDGNRLDLYDFLVIQCLIRSKQFDDLLLDQQNGVYTYTFIFDHIWKTIGMLEVPLFVQ